MVLHTPSVWESFGKLRVNCGRCRLSNNTCGAPSLHSWIEIILKEVFEGYYIDCGFVVGTKRLYPSRHDDIDPRLQHGL